MNKILPKRLLAGLITVVCIIILYSLVLTVVRRNMTELRVMTAPSDVTIFINEKKYSSKLAHVTPGVYTIVAERPGFKGAKRVVSVSTQDLNVQLILKPSSLETADFYKNNERERQLAEGLESLRQSEEGERLLKRYPIISDLPVIDIAGPFSIDYGLSERRNGSIYLLISDSSPNGRENALKWIKQRGIDPAETEIRFEDFINPLFEEGGV